MWLSSREGNFPAISKDINPAACVIPSIFYAPMWKSCLLCVTDCSSLHVGMIMRLCAQLSRVRVFAFVFVCAPPCRFPLPWEVTDSTWPLVRSPELRRMICRRDVAMLSAHEEKLGNAVVTENIWTQSVWSSSSFLWICDASAVYFCETSAQLLTLVHFLGSHVFTFCIHASPGSCSNT